MFPFDMINEVVAFPKGNIADITFVRFLAGMYPSMYIEMIS